MYSSNLLRWSGVAAMVGGALIMVKGVFIALSAGDPSLVPPAMLLQAVGLLGLHARLEGRDGLLGRIRRQPSLPSGDRFYSESRLLGARRRPGRPELSGIGQNHLHGGASRHLGRLVAAWVRHPASEGHACTLKGSAIGGGAAVVAADGHHMVLGRGARGGGARLGIAGVPYLAWYGRIGPRTRTREISESLTATT